MPCYGGPDEDDSSCLNETRKELGETEALLCSACRELESQNYDFDKNPQLSRWWDKHKKEDQKRQLKESKERIEQSRIIDLSNKPFGDLTKEDKKFLKSKGLL